MRLAGSVHAMGRSAMLTPRQRRTGVLAARGIEDYRSAHVHVLDDDTTAGLPVHQSPGLN